MQTPIFPTPAHLQCRTGPIVAWYTQPAGITFQITEPSKMTTSMAEWVVGPAFQSMLGHFTEVDTFLFMIDLRAMTGRDAHVRQSFMQLAREYGSVLRGVVIVPPVRANPLYLAGLQTASALVSVFSPPLEVTDALAEVLERYGLVAQH